MKKSMKKSEKKGIKQGMKNRYEDVLPIEKGHINIWERAFPASRFLQL